MARTRRLRVATAPCAAAAALLCAGPWHPQAVLRPSPSWRGTSPERCARRAPTLRRAFPWESLGGTLFGGKVDVPATTQEVIEALKDSVEVVVKEGRTRTDVDLPAGLRLGGVEGTLDTLSLPPGELPPERVARADRDLARYLAILLKPIESRLCILFRNGALLRAAKPAWQEAGTGGRLLAFGTGSGGKRSAFGGGGGGSAEGLQRSLADAKCEFLAVVAPRARQLPTLAELGPALGSNVKVMLLNARLRGRASTGDELRRTLSAEYEPAFHLQLFGAAGREAMLYRAMRQGGSTPWVIARRGLEPTSDGQGEKFVASVLSQTDKEPLAAEVTAALEAA